MNTEAPKSKAVWAGGPETEDSVHKRTSLKGIRLCSSAKGAQTSLFSKMHVCSVLCSPVSPFPTRLGFLSLIFCPICSCAVFFLKSRYDAVLGESDGTSGGARQLLEATKCRVSQQAGGCCGGEGGSDSGRCSLGNSRCAFRWVM